MGKERKHGEKDTIVLEGTEYTFYYCARCGVGIMEEDWEGHAGSDKCNIYRSRRKVRERAEKQAMRGGRYVNDKQRAEAGELTEKCMKCGAKLGRPYVYEVVGLTIEIGCAWVYDEDDVLCHVCMDDEILAQEDT